MNTKENFEHLYNKLKTERDEINLKLHLASMEVKDEFKLAEKKWDEVKSKAAQIASDTKGNSQEVLAKAKVVGEELKLAYKRIGERLSKTK